MDFYYFLILIFILVCPAAFINFWLIKKRKERSVRYTEFLRKFHIAVKNQNFPEMVKYGRAVLYNLEITTTDLIQMEKIVKTHALNYPELVELEKEIFQKRITWDASDAYHRELSR